MAQATARPAAALLLAVAMAMAESYGNRSAHHEACSSADSHFVELGRILDVVRYLPFLDRLTESLRVVASTCPGVTKIAFCPLV